MIVTTGSIIKVRVGLAHSYHFERSSETPGLVSVEHDGKYLDLPGNPEEAERFIAGYRRTLAEDVGYRKSEVE